MSDWKLKTFSIRVQLGNNYYFTTQKPQRWTDDEAAAELDKFYGLVDEKVMLFNIGGYKVPGIRLFRRQDDGKPGTMYGGTHTTLQHEALIPTSVLAVNVISIALERLKDPE